MAVPIAAHSATGIALMQAVFEATNPVRQALTDLWEEGAQLHRLLG